MEPQVTGTMTADQIEAMIQRTVRQVTEENEQRHQQESQGLRQSIDELRAKLDQMPTEATIGQQIGSKIESALNDYANRTDTQRMIDTALETWRTKIREHLEESNTTSRAMKGTFEETMRTFNQMIGRMDSINQLIDGRNDEIKSIHDDLRNVENKHQQLAADIDDQRHRGESITQLIIGPDGVKTLVTARLIPSMDAIQRYQDDQRREAERRRQQWQAVIKVGRVVADRAAKYPGTWQVIGFGMGALGVAAGGGLGLEGIRQLLTALRHLLLGS